MKLDLRDVRFEAFQGSGNGGSNRNAHANCVRAIHEPTGIVVRETRQRHMRQNKEAAIAELRRRLETLTADRLAARRHADHLAKPRAAFGSPYIRTYRFVPPAAVIDHAVESAYPLSILDGHLDAVLRARLAL